LNQAVGSILPVTASGSLSHPQGLSVT
jgi:hypothetical protein